MLIEKKEEFLMYLPFQAKRNKVVQGALAENVVFFFSSLDESCDVVSITQPSYSSSYIGE